LHQRIVNLNKDTKTLTNVADTPELCDFYLGSIVSRGDLKIAISTNGKSPTLGKRIRQYLEDALPSNTQSIINGLKSFRDTLKGDFASKVNALNEVTKKLSERED
jgi:siroheme synthase-like protein